MSPVRRADLLGFPLATLGAVIVMGTLWAVAKHDLESTGFALTYGIIGVLMIALGMYVVIPNETKNAIETISEASDHWRPFARRRGDTAEQPAAPAVKVTPSPETAVIVAPPGQKPVEVPAAAPELAPGETEIPDFIDDKNESPSMETLPLVSRPSKARKSTAAKKQSIRPARIASHRLAGNRTTYPAGEA